MITKAQTYKETVEQVLNIIFFNHMFETEDKGLHLITIDLENALTVLFPFADVNVVEVQIDGSGDLTALIEMNVEGELIKITGELLVNP